MTNTSNPSTAREASSFNHGDWEAAFGNLEVGVSIISPDFRLEYFNDAFGRFVGVPSEIKHGCAVVDLYRLMAERGDLGEGEVETLALERVQKLNSGDQSEIIENSDTGNIFRVSHRIAEGGYIVSSMTNIANSSNTNGSNDDTILLSVLNAAEQGILIVDKNGNVELFNKSFADMFTGISNTAGKPATYLDYFQMAWKAGNFRYDFPGADMDQSGDGGIVTIIENCCEASLNEPQIFTLSNGRHIRFSTEIIEGDRKILSFVDDTENVLNEREVKSSRNKSEIALNDFRAAFDNMDAGIALTDGDLNILLINNEFHDIWGTNSDDFRRGQNFRVLIDVNRANGVYDVEDEDWEDYIEQRLAEIKAGDIARREFVRADGKILIYSCTALSDGQRLIKYSDVTEFKMRETALKKAKVDSDAMLADFSSAINNMDVGLVLVDNDLNTLLINDAFHEIWNTTAEDFTLGESFRSLLDVNRRNGIYDVKDEDWDDYVQSRMDEINHGNIEAREFFRADGKVLVYSCSVLSSGQKLLSYADISEFKSREEDLKNAQFQAESADRSKSEFLANMSHEIRTPMNGVMGMAELLGRTDLDTKQKMFTDVILSSSTALLTIINDILDFSKIEAGKLELDLAPFNLSTVIEDVATLVSTGVVEKDLELIVRIQPGLEDNLLGDAGRFRQILTNLIGNAVKFTETGHILVDVSGEANDGVLQLKCSVQDTGIGIPEKQINAVFEKFSQVDASSTRRHEGTGLGLAITTRLVNLMGGEIGCESVLGEGSTFWFNAKLPIDENANPVKLSRVDIAGARVLAIDDNSVNRSILLEQFDAWKLIGKDASTGLEGLAMLRSAIRAEEPFDAVVLDYQMPDMNGVEVAQVIRSDELLQHIPIIMLTSADGISESSEFKAQNIDAHLIKPARASQLLECVINVLAKSSANVNSDRDEPAEANPVGAKPEDHDAENQSAPTMDEAEPSKVEAEPVAKVSDPLPAEETASIATVDTEEPNPAGDGELFVLVAEDNEVNQMVFSQILEYQDINFKIVENGQLAVEEALKSRPPIILMDVSMPVMNGHEATAEIRRLTQELPDNDAYRPTIVAVTAHALKDDRDKCIAAGMDDYMSKPISPDMLVEKIEYWSPGGEGEIAKLA